MGNVRVISASAGSGKTWRLAYEYVKGVVSNPFLYRRILAVTFTNKATEEMKSRILEKIQELAEGEKSDFLPHLEEELRLTPAEIRRRAAEARGLILHDYSRFAVLTIDRFFQRLIRSFVRELGVEVNFNLELETDPLLAVAADMMVEDISADEELRGRLFRIAREQVEANRRWNIKVPLIALGRELFGEEYRKAGADEGPESGPIVEAVVEKGERIRREIKEVASEACAMIAGAGLSAADFKGKSSSVAAHFAQVARGDLKPLSKYALAALESDDAWAHPDSPLRGVAESLVPQLAPLLRTVNDLYEDNLRLMNSSALLKDNYRNFQLLGDLRQRIERICAEQNIMPISETNRMISQLVGGNDAPFIFEKAGSYYSRFMIDEFQDTSLLQWENFVPLLADAVAANEGWPVMLIGDVKQAIYRWRGGDWQILARRVSEEMGPDRVDTHTLATNFRSARQVVEFNNAVVGLVAAACNADLDAMVDGALAGGAIDAAMADELRGMMSEAYSGHAQQPKTGAGEGYVTLTVYGPDEEGAYIPPVIERIEELQSRGFAPEDIAVLVRSNDQGTRIARMLLARKHADPGSPYCYDVITQEALTVGSARVSRFIIACLSISADPADAISRAIHNRWLGRPFDEPLDDEDTAFFARAASMPPEQAFEEIVMRYGLQSRVDEIAYIQAVHEQINSFSSGTVADTALFLKWWNEKGVYESVTMQKGGRAITISTIHKSKGLQYRAVIIPYLSWRLSPGTGVVWAEGAGEGLEKTGRLPVRIRREMADSYFAPGYYREQVLAQIDAVNMFYVAVTRAEEELHLMMSSNPRDNSAIGGVVRRVMTAEDDAAVSMGPVRGVRTVSDGLELMEFGTPLTPERGDRPAVRALKIYSTNPPGTKVRLRLPSSRYFGEAEARFAPRDLGVLMHKAFEEAENIDDIRAAMSRMSADGMISDEERGRLEKLVASAFADPLVAGWFGGGWDEVRNENDILVPGSGSPRRPDRVMIRGTQAVVVDYKFGQAVVPSHARQVADYLSLLCRMGYEHAEGYVWYVALDRIEKVSDL